MIQYTLFRVSMSLCAGSVSFLSHDVAHKSGWFVNVGSSDSCQVYMNVEITDGMNSE